VRPLIGITTHTHNDETNSRYAIHASYTRAVEVAGGAPILIPLDLGDDSLRAVFDRLDGLLIPGGVDVDPKEYGEQVAPYCGSIDPAEDATEQRLLRWAFEKPLAILGICRGIQMLNVAAGGSLYQDVDAQLPNLLHHPHIQGNPRNFRAHTIEVKPQSRLARALGTSQIEVNSRHHQAVKEVAPGFHVTAHAPDGIIEGIEPDDLRHFVLGVQFHPENLIDDDVRTVGIFKEFVKAAQAQ
jgi:putative glutamine amidotransferase